MDWKTQYYVVGDNAYMVCTLSAAKCLAAKEGQPTRFEQSAAFPADLIRLLYLDYEKVEALVHHADRELQTLIETKDPACIGRVREDMAKLRELHPFFKVTELEWNDSLTAAEEKGMKGLTNLLPRKRLSHITSELYMIQRQIKEIFYRVLDVDREKSTVLERLEVYYSDHKDEKLRTYSFRPLSTRYEKTPQGFAEVLYPESVFDVVDFCLRLCIQREERMRVCKNCGRYFAVGKTMKSEYCTNFPDEKGRTCRDTGAIAAWTKKRENDDVFKTYRREYKKRFARIKAGTLYPDDFYKWSQQARQKKEECDAGTITPEEFAAWLAKS